MAVDKDVKELIPVKKRLASIDAFRGMTIALMLIADNPGNPLRVYPQLRHALWNGWTLADLAFPFFVLIMGMVIPIALKRRLQREETKLALFSHILSRSVVIFLAGLFLNGFPLFDLSIIRIPGVLQRLALVYFITGLVYLTLEILSRENGPLKKKIHNRKLLTISVELFLSLIILLLYAWLFHFSPVPEQGNLLQKVDLHFLKGHLYTPDWDPEGILSTVPAIASGLFGLIAGEILTYPYKKKDRSFIVLFFGGTILFYFGLTWNRWVPINKNIWSSSYVLLTSGLAYILTALLYFGVDLKKKVTLFKPLILLGSKPILVYVLSEIVRKTLWVIPITSQVLNKTLPINVWLTTSFITPWAGEKLDSFYFSVFYVGLWCYIVYSLKHKEA